MLHNNGVGQIRHCCKLGLAEGLPGGHLGLLFALWFCNRCHFIFIIEGFFGVGSVLGIESLIQQSGCLEQHILADVQGIAF